MVNRPLKKAHLPIACHWQALKIVALDRLASTYYLGTPPLVGFSRASHLGPF